MFVQNFKAIHQIYVKIFLSGAKWWTNQQADIANHRAMLLSMAKVSHIQNTSFSRKALKEKKNFYVNRPKGCGIYFEILQFSFKYNHQKSLRRFSSCNSDMHRNRPPPAQTVPLTRPQACFTNRRVSARIAISTKNNKNKSSVDHRVPLAPLCVDWSNEKNVKMA